MTFRAHFEHRDQLLRAALEEFCEHGYEGASVNRILAASATSKGQLYHHFPGKEGLYLGLVEWMVDMKIAWFAAHPLPAVDDFFETLEAQMRASLDFAVVHPDVDRFGRALLGERGRPIFAAVVARFGFDPSSTLGALVAHGYALGQLRDDLSLEFVQRAVLLVVNHAPDLLDLTQPADLSTKLAELLAFLREGLAPA